MAMQLPTVRVPGLLSSVTLALSTNADGLTGSDVADLGGASPCAIEVSSLATDANYSFKGSIDSTADMKTVLDTTGNPLVYGSTVAGVTSGKIIAVDPAKFQGLRYLQVMSGTSAAAIAGSTGSSVKLGLKPISAIK